MRLNQFIAHNTKYSRREADGLIAQGRVFIERTKAILGQELEEGKRVFLDGRIIKPSNDESFTVIVYHKPKGELVTKKDDRNRRVIFDNLGKKYAHFTPVGRLDFASEGLLILTDSKEVAHHLMHSDLEREYILKIGGKITKEMIEAMENGLELQDAKAGSHQKTKITSMHFKPFDFFSIYKNENKISKIKVGISEGKNRELRRFFAHFKADVLDLRRVRYGWIELNSLPLGKVRYLNRGEYKKLHLFMKEKMRIKHED
ncbi:MULTISPECIES: pseudouridine synthase [unclassified Helicobacter]|uniref:pseudouridine synthase n=1 Tax=unclassified Helicobacter TaxID=2593540 RepID=UPI000CF0DF53|nr:MULTISPECIES: pseudouridine synthase [unclassified Helicobacter]